MNPMVLSLAMVMAGFFVPVSAAQPKAAAAPNWVVFEMMPEGTIYIDPASIQKQGDRADMWVLIDYKQPLDDRTGKKVQSDKLHYRYDCSARQFSIITSSAHVGPMGGGAVIDVNTDPQMAPVPPGTTAEQMWQRACGGAK
jgi:hypothetical protein